MTATETQIERHGFGAEVGRLLDLVVHSLYSEREIFLRELVANAADATDRRRFESLTHPALALPEAAAIRLRPHKPGRTLTIEDSGIGMTREELIDHLGTIARSGTRAFGQALAEAKPEDRPSLIGQFGVGFYSAFMVADRVEVTSRKAGAEEAFTWASDGTGEFTIAPATRDAPGTDVVLHIKSDAEEYLDPIRIEAVVRKWADHITIPITIERDGKDVPANEGTALWRKPRAEVTEQAYNEFYRHLGHLFDTPWATLHWHAEGALEFSALLFIPGSRPFEPLDNDRTSKLRLHVRRMFITDAAELLPPWLRFVQGVVDTEDLPLNVSREMLQSTPVLARIRRAVTNRVLTELKSKAKEPEDYNKFWENFGAVLKEGVWEDSEHRKDVAPLLRFRSSSVDGLTSLPDYVARMKDAQEAIYILAGDNAEALSRSAQLEGFRARGLEVLLLTDPIDAFWPDRMDEFEGKPIRSVTQGAADLSKLPPTDAPEGEAPTSPPDRRPEISPRRRRDRGPRHRPPGGQCRGPGRRHLRPRPADATPAPPRRPRHLHPTPGAGNQPPPPPDRHPRNQARHRRGRHRPGRPPARPRPHPGRRPPPRPGQLRAARRGGAGGALGAR